MRSQTYESALTKQGVKFTYLERFDLDELDVKKSLNNQARLGMAIDEELVAKYATSYKDGDDFPPLVIWKPGRGRHILIDGNQRTAALLKLNRKRSDAYLVESTDEVVIDRLTWTFNNIVNGKRLSDDEVLRHAVTFVRKHGYSGIQAAKTWNLPQWKVARAVRVEETREALDRHNVKNTASASPNVLDILAQLAPAGEDVLVAAGELALEAGLGDVKLDRVIKDVQAARTSEAKKKVIEEAAASEEVQSSRAETAGGKIKKPLPRSRLVSTLRPLLRILEAYPAKTLRPAPEAVYLSVREDAQQVVDKLTEVFGLGVRRAAQ